MTLFKELSIIVAVRLAMLMEAPRRWLSRLIVLVVTSLTANLVHADDDVAGMIKSVLDGVKSLKDPIVDASLVIGLGFLVAGFFMLKGKRNNPQITAFNIVIVFVVGFCFIAIGQIAKRGQKQMGLNPVSL